MHYPVKEEERHPCQNCAFLVARQKKENRLNKTENHSSKCIDVKIASSTYYKCLSCKDDFYLMEYYIFRKKK